VLEKSAKVAQKRQPNEYRRLPPTGQHDPCSAAVGSRTGHDEIFGEYLQNHFICKWFEQNPSCLPNANSHNGAPLTPAPMQTGRGAAARTGQRRNTEAVTGVFFG
jgi:hypothetical protein